MLMDTPLVWETGIGARQQHGKHDRTPRPIHFEDHPAGAIQAGFCRRQQGPRQRCGLGRISSITARMSCSRPVSMLGGSFSCSGSTSMVRFLLSSAEGFAARAARFGVWVVEGEARALQRHHEIDRRAGEVFMALIVDEHLDAVALDHGVVRLSLVGQASSGI